MPYIAIGNCSKYNIYILVSIISIFLRDLLFGLNSANKDKPVRIFPFEAKITRHNLLYNFINFASIFFGGVILYILERKNHKSKNNTFSIETYEKMKIKILKKKDESNLLNLILIGIFFPLFISVKGFVDASNVYVGFWTFEIMYICILSHFILKIKISKHKRFAIYIMLGLSVITFLEFFLPHSKTENNGNINELTDKNVFDQIKIKFGIWTIPLFILANEILHIQRDFCWIKGKYLMDIKSFSPAKIFLTIGCFGFFYAIIFFSIFTYIPCKTFNNIEKNGDYYINLETNKTLELYKEYCQLRDYDENTKTLYLLYDSMKLISKEYSNTEKENILEIFLIIPLLFIFHMINELSCLMMVRYTDPNNILIYKNFYFFIKRIIAIIINEGNEKYITYQHFFTLELEEVVSIISNMIYIEVLELRFCKLDYELKRNIILRSFEDLDAIEENHRQSINFEIDNNTDNSDESEKDNEENVMIEI